MVVIIVGMIGVGVGVNVGDGEGVGVLVALAVGTEEMAVGSGLDVGASETAAAEEVGVVLTGWGVGERLATGAMRTGVEVWWVVAVGDTWVWATGVAVGSPWAVRAK